MDIKPGYYRTRSGRKAYVIGIAPAEFAYGHPIRGMIQLSGNGLSQATWTDQWWLTNGHIADNMMHRNDLISEWKEPRVVEGVIIIDQNSLSPIYQSRMEAERFARPNSIFRTVRYTEGGKIEDITEEA